MEESSKEDVVELSNPVDDNMNATETLEHNVDISKLDPKFSQLLVELDKLVKMLDEESDITSLYSIDTKDVHNEKLLKIIHYINSNRARIYESLVGITENVIGTVKSMTECSRTLDNIHNESTQLAEYSSTIASAAEELSATINSISKNVQNTVQASGEAKKLAEQGDEVIDSTLSKIQNVNNVLNTTNESLSILMSTAEQANTIIKVVNDISAKTDLLALNASIEAARAGAAGKGFAVVAHEVGRLSEKTQSSINEIETILNNIQKNVKVVSEDLKTGIMSATEATEQVSVAKTSIDNIVSRIHHVDNEVSNIGSAIKEQAQAVADIAQNVSTISNGSKELNAQVEEVSDIIDNVTKTSNSTRNLLGVYDMGGRSLLLQSQVDHLFWMHRLRRMLEGKERIQQEEFVDHTKCRLGKWYLSVNLDNQTQKFKELYNQLDEPHAKLHSIAANVIRLYNSGNLDEAFKKYGECLPISVDIVSILERMLDVIN